MANVLVNDTSLADIADAIREKNGTAETYKPAEMGAAIREIESGGGTGIILSDFTGPYTLPQVADLRNIPELNGESFFNSGNRFSNMFANDNKNPTAGFYTILKEVYLPKIKAFSVNMFGNCSNLTKINGDFTETVSFAVKAFYNCSSLTEIPYTPNLEQINNQAFYGCTGLAKVCIYNTLTTFNTGAFTKCTNLKDIYVPWAEGAVNGAPWGATNATIHYNTVYDENNEPIV